MFYENQPTAQQANYKKMLGIIGKLSLLFSDSDSPYLPYRCHENIFCKYFEAENLGRKDCSADAKKNQIGIGLKTWVGSSDQKVAEFNKLRPQYKHLSGLDLIKEIAKYRNERIRITKNLYNITQMIYHIVKRIPHQMQIFEHDFDYIDVDRISLINRGNDNNTYFTDGKHVYHFSTSKNTLYMIFDKLEMLDCFDVEILDDPYSYLLNLENQGKQNVLSLKAEPKKDQICLRLYSTDKTGKFVPLRSGLNQWNANGRKRGNDELYIPYPSEDRKRNPDFFPPKDASFSLKLPDGKIISAKVCQQDNKAIMSNPNKDLGQWLLRKVFELKPQTVVTYNMLEIFNIDCVIFTKNADFDYSIDFGEIGTYETFYNLDTEKDISL